MKNNIIVNKTFDFAVRIVKACKYLSTQKNEFVLSKQLLRSGTSVGANVRESQEAESKKDFIHKLQISQKEISDTIYWLELLYATKYISAKEFESLHNDAVEIKKIIRSIILSSKGKIKS